MEAFPSSRVVHVSRYGEAISLQIDCATQEEIDHYWSRLMDGGEEVQCGWLKDRYGLSWQVVPSMLQQLLDDPDARKTARVTQAFLQMKKFDITALKLAEVPVRRFDGAASWEFLD